MPAIRTRRMLASVFYLIATYLFCRHSAMITWRRLQWSRQNWRHGVVVKVTIWKSLWQSHGRNEKKTVMTV